MKERMNRNCGNDRFRTRDPRNANAMLYQLSYIPFFLTGSFTNFNFDLFFFFKGTLNIIYIKNI